MKTLKQLANKCNTDKQESRHDYASAYDSLFTPFRQDTFNFLEIGVYYCKSHKMWRDYFPNATIYGIDILQEFIDPFKNEERLVLQQLDQGSKQQLVEYSKNGPWRVIIDDGSHRSSHQKLTFEVLWNSVEAGGYYVIEDTQTSFFTKNKYNFVDCKVTLVQRMLSLAYEVSSTPGYWGPDAWVGDLGKHAPSKHQDSIESIQFSAGLIILKKKDTANYDTHTP